MPYLGIDIGGTKLQSAVVDAAGRILFARTETVAADPDGPLARIAAGRPADARHLAGAIAAGDAAARSILSDAARSYAWGLSQAVHLLNPEVIVLGGGVAMIGEAWREGVAQHLESFLMKPMRPGPPVKLAALGQSVVLVGAALVGASADR
jgi:glucokinase